MPINPPAPPKPAVTATEVKRAVAANTAIIFFVAGLLLGFALAHL